MHDYVRDEQPHLDNINTRIHADKHTYLKTLTHTHTQTHALRHADTDW